MPPQNQAAQTLARQGYHLVGGGAVKPCLWLNRAMRGGDQCYKHHFYGISSHRCVQMTPTLECNHLCLHCWRPIDDPVPGIAPLEPAELLDGILCGQQKFLSGYGGAKTTDLERLAEAREPKHVALSLMGEPTLYPYLKELIDLIRKRGMTTFVVSNATNPEVLAELQPTQLYLSINAPDEEMYRRVCRPAGDFWPKIIESLEIIKQHRCRSVIRMTLVRGLNMEQAGGLCPPHREGRARLRRGQGLHASGPLPRPPDPGGHAAALRDPGIRSLPGRGPGLRAGGRCAPQPGCPSLQRACGEMPDIKILSRNG